MNMGSMNFGLYPMLDRYKDWKYEWEPRQLEMTRDFIFRNTFKDIERILKDHLTGSDRSVVIVASSDSSR